MTSLPKKVKKSVPGGPDVQAIKPKPSINMLGQNTKRPSLPKPERAAATTPTTQSPSVPPQSKKPRLDFSSTVPAPKPQTPTAAQSTAHLRPPLEDLHKSFCESIDLDYDGFETALEEMCSTEKYNKAVRMICAALRDVEKKKEASGSIAFEENVIVAISKAVKEHGEYLKNVNLSRSIFYILCTTKGMQPDKQSVLVSWVTHLNEVQSNSDPVVITSYLHDALGDRSWIDKPHSLELVTRILKYFGTRFPSRAMYHQSGSDVSTPDYIPDESVTPLYFGGDDEELMKKNTLDYLVKSWEHYGESPPRSLLRTLNAFSAFPEVRAYAAKKVDAWLQNAKLQRVALEVLLFLGCNIADAASNEMDRETLGHLLKLRSYKSKMVTPVYAVMLKEIVSRKKNLSVIVHLMLNNEFGHPQARYHLNMQLFHTLFSIDNPGTTKILGSEMAQVITMKEEHYKPARLFIRELVRSCLRTDFLFSNFAQSFMDRIALMDKMGKELLPHVARMTVDTCTWLPLVAITQQIKDAFANRRANGHAAPSALETINKFQSEMREYHRAVIQCLNALHPLISKPEQEMEFEKTFYRMLFLDARDKPDSYVTLETGTSDEVAKGIAVILECPINERLICLMAKCDALSKEERLTLIDKVINNAIISRPTNDTTNPLMNITTLMVFETLFKLAEFKEGFTLEPWFWKTWQLCLLLLCATPPPPIFVEAYNSYPMIRMLTKMILLGNFAFPLNFEGKTKDEVNAEFEKLREEESTAAADECIDDEEIQSAMCRMNPTTSIRPPPGEIALELATLAAFYRMPAELAQLRNPDLLSALIEEEGSTAAMPAIEAVIAQKSDAHSFIPIVCITQFLLHYLMTDEEKKSVEESVILQMGSRLRETLRKCEVESEWRDSFELLFTRLASPRRSDREAAVAVLSYLFDQAVEFPRLGQPFSLEAVTAFPVFEDQRTYICTCIGEAFRVESDPARLDLYVRFLTKHGEVAELHTLSIFLAHSSSRHDDSIRSSLIHFFARYVEKSNDSVVKENMKMVIMDVNKRKIKLVSTTLFFILELLSRFRGGGEGRDRLLSLILSPNGDLPTVIDENGKTIELLNDNLRGAMLSSTDESIVKVALGRVDMNTSFSMICKCGLTVFSASNLLKNLDALDEASFCEIPNAQKALPFVIAYRKQGAQGGEKFLELLNRRVESEMKEEPMDECDDFVLLPPPNFHHATVTQTPEVPLLTKGELKKKLREMVSSSSFALTSLEFKSAAASEANTDVCLETLELNLKFFFSHVGAFNDMVQLLTSASEKFPSVKSKLRTLCAKVLKSASVPAAIEDQIRKLAEGPAPATAPKTKTTAPAKKPLDLKCATAEDLLETLHKRKNMTTVERARLINRFVLLRPEIIDIRMSDAEIDRQISRVFGVQSREGLDRLVAKLWLQASPETIECVLKRILAQYNQNISPSAVMELLRHCASSPSYMKGLSRDELQTACAYIVEKATEEYPTFPEYLSNLGDFIHNLLPITGNWLLEDIAYQCVQIDRSTAPRDRRVAAAAFLEELQVRFPSLHVSTCSSTITITGTHNGIASADRELTMKLRVLFDCKDDSDVISTIDSLTHIIHFNKPIVLRQLPVMSRLIARISENPPAQIKEFRRFRSIINFLISSMIDLMDDLEPRNIADLDRMIDGLLDFYEKHVAGTRDETELSRRLIHLMMAYINSHRKDARDFIYHVGGERVSVLLTVARPDRDESFDEVRYAVDGV